LAPLAAPELLDRSALPQRRETTWKKGPRPALLRALNHED